jgi:hypothetical protein
VPEWKIIQSKLTSYQDRAQLLLDEWHRLRSAGACAFLLDIQQHKDKLESLAAVLSAEMYCSPVTQDLIEACNRFELELDRLRQKVYQDLLAGLQNSKTK